MNSKQFLESYGNDSRIGRLVQSIKKNQNTALLNGIGSQTALFAAATLSQTAYTGLFILRDPEETAYFQNDLQQILPDKNILLLPSAYKKQGDFSKTDGQKILMRSKVIEALMSNDKAQYVIVSYPEAVQEMIVAQEVIAENTLKLQIGEKVSVDFMLDILLEYAFERVDFVYEPGEFSIRGGIIDIFSFGNDYPYRVELFDDEVESIRTFDPQEQTSIRRISSLRIVPNIHQQFKKEKHSPIFDFLPEKSFVWIAYPDEIEGTWQNNYHLAVLAHQGAENTKGTHPLKGVDLDKLFIPEDILSEKIKDFPTVVTGVYKAPEGYQTIDLNGQSQPTFDRNFDLIISDIRQLNENGYRTFLLSESPKQLERLKNIFEDLQATLSWSGVEISLEKGFIDSTLKIAVYTDHQIFGRFHKYKTEQGFSRNKAITLRELQDLNPGDYVTHIDHGVGIFSGLQRLEINDKVQEVVRIKYGGTDTLFVNIHSLHKLSKYSGREGTTPKIYKLGSNAWSKLKERTKSKVKDIARDLIRIYAQRKMVKGFSFSKDTYLQHELEASFIYEDTPDQEKAIQDVKADMEQPYPMDRLICGDVGFGKTEVAIRAAFKAVNDSKQVAVLVPTTILAWQHYKTFSERLKGFPVKIDYINRFKTTKEKNDTIQKVKSGETDIIIGTHALLGKQILFKDLGLLVVDEEQKFGVSAKEKLKAMTAKVDVLTLSATPIPRTLKFSLMGARDLSNIMTPPPNRQPIHTELISFNRQQITEAIENEIVRGGQVFFIHNKVSDIAALCDKIRSMVPGIEVEYAHGQMEGKDLEQKMMDFIEGKFDVLISTNIIESGLDIPNANTIIINNAHHFGLSDLHQMRGRVGRSNKKAYCYLISPPIKLLTKEAGRRIQAVEEFSDLGSGFQIAMRDMDIRGAGNLLGSEQSGFIADIGFDMYHKILEEAIQELKQTDFKEVFQEQIDQQTEFVKDCTIDTDSEMYIPMEYVSSTEERLKLYTELEHIVNEEDLTKYKEVLEDRFGPIPKEVEELFEGLRVRWSAKKVGFERIILKAGKMRCYFIENQNSPFFETNIFRQILTNIQQNKRASLKQSSQSLILTFESIWTMEQAKKMLDSLIVCESE
ncbi:MAG: transcription-repair coupling factor [Chitinophagales bacterium]|nr:transcription-repair coupling factor [Chitinophagales bacterium]